MGGAARKRLLFESGRVMGKSVTLKVPDGFERVQMDLNKNRDGSPYIAMCVSRRPSKQPITDVLVIAQPKEEKARTVTRSGLPCKLRGRVAGW